MGGEGHIWKQKGTSLNHYISGGGFAYDRNACLAADDI